MNKSQLLQEKKIQELENLAMQTAGKLKKGEPVLIFVKKDLESWLLGAFKEIESETAKEIYDYVNEHIMTMSDLDFKAFTNFIANYYEPKE